MTFIFFLAFLMAVCKGGILIALGLLLRKYFTTVLNLFIRKPLPENFMESDEYQKTNVFIKTIGFFVLCIGVIIILQGFSTWIVALHQHHIPFSIKH
ncbi:hypothetical protein EYV94_14945 [Puteibacter caeruleilacunae]|nr:hypothetical protein EYV94_14945 [Puteibacter caeruleilacunae]